MTELDYRCAMEAILFAAGDPVEAGRLAAVLELSEDVIRQQMDLLIASYAKEPRGVTIIKLNNSYQMVSVKAYAEYIRRAMDLRRNIPLSQAAMEVLAVIAYNQPVTKSFVEQVRGVDCSGVIGSLTAKGLIEEKGRLELPGRPLLYGTTEHFLRCFSISSIDELPPIPGSEEEAKAEQLSIFEPETPDDRPADGEISGTVEEIVEEAVEGSYDPEEA